MWVSEEEDVCQRKWSPEHAIECNSAPYLSRSRTTNSPESEVGRFKGAGEAMPTCIKRTVPGGGGEYSLSEYNCLGE